MSTDSKVTTSAEGTRPTTSGGTDNIGAGEKLSTTHNAAGGDVSAPAPGERMNAKRANVESTKHDDSASFGLHEDLSTEPNTEPRGQDDHTPVNSPKG